MKLKKTGKIQKIRVAIISDVFCWLILIYIEPKSESHFYHTFDSDHWWVKANR